MAGTTLLTDESCDSASESAVLDELADHDSLLLAYLRRRLPAGEDERDYVQEVYLRVLAMSGADRARVVNWSGFLVRAASNLMIDKSRRRRARRDDLHVDLEQALAIADDYAFDGERTALGRERVRQVEGALAALDHAARRALIAVRVHGMSHGQIAGELGVARKDVSRLIERALHSLACNLARQDGCV